MQPNHPSLQSLTFFASGLAITAALSCHVQAAPEGGVIRAGTGTIGQSGATTTVHQGSERVAIDWQSFDIAVDERVEFIQPSTSALALNRVLSNDATTILGNISANGHILLVNPNGVLFGESATVDVGGLVASGLDIKTKDFVEADLELSTHGGRGGNVINSGLIHAASGGNVVLLGERVANAGVITAQLGTVTLAGGRAAVLTFDAEQRIGVRLTKASIINQLDDASAVSNEGAINAYGGQVQLTAQVSRDLFSQAVNTGDLSAEIAVAIHDDGSFSLDRAADVATTGTIDVSSVSLPAPVVPEEPGDNTAPTAASVSLSGRNIKIAGTINANIGTGYSSWIEADATEILHLDEATRVSAAGSFFGDDQYQALAAGGPVSLTGQQIELEQDVRINASGIGGGSIKIGDTNTKRVRIESGSLNVGGASPGDGGYGGRSGNLTVFAKDAVEFGANFNARGGTYGAGGQVRIISEGTLGFSGSGGVNGGYWNYESGEIGPSGLITLAAPDLILSKNPTATSISEAALAEIAHHPLRLEATNSITVVAGDDVLVTPRNLVISARSQTDSLATINLKGLVLNTDYSPWDGFTALIEADGQVIPPQPGIDWPYQGWWPRPINVTVISHQGSIDHQTDVHMYNGNYHASAAKNVTFAPGTWLRTLIEGEPRTASEISIDSGGDVRVNLSSAGLLSSGAGVTMPLAIVGKNVYLNAQYEIPTANIIAEKLTMSANGVAVVNAEVCGTTSLSSPDGADWVINGNLNRLNAELGDGSSLQLEDRNSLVLGRLSLTDSSAAIVANGAIKQSNDSIITLRQSALSLQADNLYLGGAGAASIDLRGGANTLTGAFDALLKITGAITSDADSDELMFTGSAANNVITITETAQLCLSPNNAAQFDLGDGSDHMSIAAPGTYAVALGAGADQIEIAAPNTNVDLLDFDSNEDTVINTSP